MPYFQSAKLRQYLKLWALPLVLGLICAGITLFDPPTGDWFQFDRTKILDGEIWRLLTGNIVHLNSAHLALNLAGLVICWLFFAGHFTMAFWCLLLVACSLGTGLGLLWLNPELEWYVGLSGTLHGLFIAGALKDLRQKRVEGYLLLALLVGKLAWEQFTGPLPGSEETAGGRVIVDAHLYGAVTGLVTALALHYLPSNHKNTEKK